MKKEINKEKTKCCCCSSSKIKNIHLIFLVLILGVAIGVYARYWNVASVNGKGITRMAYYKNLRKSDANQILDQMIIESLIKSEAVKKGVKVEANVISDEIKIIEDQIKTQGQTLDEALAARGMTKTDLENSIELQKIVEKMATSSAEITQVQIDEFLKTNKTQLPAKATKDELQKLAKDELTKQASDSAISTWLEKLKTEAKIIYK